ncbi:DUF2019 domain-containing protein [Archangium primigenium]|uniref:DUF2019 domain-containing protein n=1 Tax=[Archangium] primigenium TaxID=2792470 RepID=UPI001956F5BA|nr:DUF2019 domain-containing protein [Archangium primigenium]
MNLDRLVEEFAVNVAAQTDCIWNGDSKKGNRHAKRYLSAFDKLRAHGAAGRAALAGLFVHPRMDVRVKAAAYLLRYRTDDAKKILEDAAKREGMIPFIAAQVLRNWEEGVWNLDPE